MYEENNLVFNPNPKITVFHKIKQNTNTMLLFQQQNTANVILLGQLDEIQIQERNN